MNLYLDIETIPGQHAWIKDRIAETIQPPGNIKKQETIDAWNEEKKPGAIEEQFRKCGLSGTVGEVIAIGWAFNDEPISAMCRTLNEPEADLLQTFFEAVHNVTELRRPTWIGHYITGFDLRFLWQRCVVNKVKPAVPIPYDAKPWSEEIFDTKHEWTGTQGGHGSLDEVCLAMDIPGKDGFDGSMVYDAVINGEYERIRQYVADDVFKVRELHKRMTFADQPAVNTVRIA